MRGKLRAVVPHPFIHITILWKAIYSFFFFFEFAPWASVAGGLHVEEMNSVSFWVPDALLPCCLFTLFEGLVFTLP